MLDDLVEFHAFEGELLELVRQVSRMRGDPPILLALEEYAPSTHATHSCNVGSIQFVARDGCDSVPRIAGHNSSRPSVATQKDYASIET
jgi:hypothetical protein